MKVPDSPACILALEMEAELISEIYGFTHNDFYKIPNTTGITGAKGFYNVTEFRLNNKAIPYRPEASVRWQDAAFEDWSELSFTVANRPSEISMAAPIPDWLILKK